jgi:hypothetical protein
MLLGRTLNDVGQKSASRSGPQVLLWGVGSQDCGLTVKWEVIRLERKTGFANR